MPSSIYIVVNNVRWIEKNKRGKYFTQWVWFLRDNTYYSTT